MRLLAKASPTCCSSVASPTNDLDTDTLASMEDLLDTFQARSSLSPTTATSQARHRSPGRPPWRRPDPRALPGGVEQYLHRCAPPATSGAFGSSTRADGAGSASRSRRAARADLLRAGSAGRERSRRGDAEACAARRSWPASGKLVACAPKPRTWGELTVDQVATVASAVSELTKVSAQHQDIVGRLTGWRRPGWKLLRQLEVKRVLAGAATTAELRPSTCPPRQPGSTSAVITCTTNQTPSSTSARFRFDEAHTLLNRQVTGRPYSRSSRWGRPERHGIDFIELEEVLPEIQRPADAVSIMTTRSAQPGDGVDDYDALIWAMNEGREHLLKTVTSLRNLGAGTKGRPRSFRSDDSGCGHVVHESALHVRPGWRASGISIFGGKIPRHS